MILTEKCKVAFEEWCSDNYSQMINTEFDESYSVFISCMPYVCENALITEFFDSVGIYISIQRLSVTGWYNFNINDKYTTSFASRTEALKAAITEANRLFNDKN